MRSLAAAADRGSRAARPIRKSAALKRDVGVAEKAGRVPACRHKPLIYGERGGNRTHDPLIKSQMLYLLSYALAFGPKAWAPRAYPLAGHGSTTFVRASSSAARAALRRLKSSPAWCEERVSGEAETSRKPLASPIVA